MKLCTVVDGDANVENPMRPHPKLAPDLYINDVIKMNGKMFFFKSFIIIYE